LRSVAGSSTNAPSGTGGDFRFHGQWLEIASGLYHMRARDYDPKAGRFLSRDPDEGNPRTPESLHPYQFANNNPLVYIDPSGQFSVIEINLTSAIQGGLQVARTAAINEGKKYVRKKIGEFVADQFFNVLKGFLPIDLNALGGLVKGAEHKYAGFRFSKFAEEFLCEELDLPDSIWFEPQVRRSGRVVSNGLSCSDRGSHRTPIGPYPLVPRPDFIIGREPPLDEVSGIHSRAYVIGELKLSGMGLYRSYVKPKTQEGQLSAVLNYARHHTIPCVAVFGTLLRPKQWQKSLIKIELTHQAAKHGVVVFVVSVQ
jgi:RHS repeat-associated protein